MGEHPPIPLSDAEFFSLAQKIIRHHARMLKGLFGFTEHDVPDIQQELFLEVYKRLDNFDPAVSKEITFISRVVENKVMKLIEHRQAKRRDWRKCQESLNETIAVPGVGVVEKVNTVESPQHSDPLLILDVSMILERLPPDLLELCNILKYYAVNEALSHCSMAACTFFQRLNALKDVFLQAGIDEKFYCKTLPPPV
jgi:DNA-directed RNA polymerase specialized sigma24 family protein